MTLPEQNAARIEQVERAIIQINHFTESLEKLDLVSWKADISADVRWLKYLLGAGVLTGAVQVVLQIVKEAAK